MAQKRSRRVTMYRCLPEFWTRGLNTAYQIHPLFKDLQWLYWPFHQHPTVWPLSPLHPLVCSTHDLSNPHSLQSLSFIPPQTRLGHSYHQCTLLSLLSAWKIFSFAPNKYLNVHTYFIDKDGEVNCPRLHSKNYSQDMNEVPSNSRAHASSWV